MAAICFGAGWQAAIVMGGVVAMSSTAITLKQLSDDGDLGSQHGRLAVGILLFQDSGDAALSGPGGRGTARVSARLTLSTSCSRPPPS